MAELQLQSTITCPHCGHQATETMPANACVAFYDCKECGETLKPLPGSCCVFCSYGSVPCPPIQQGVEPCCDPLPRQSSRDWLGSTRTSLMAWWIPTALIIAGLLVTAPFRTGIWVAALAWMGIACLLNARQCGRTHCRYTGPYYLAMVVPVLIVGAGIIPLSLSATAGLRSPSSFLAAAMPSGGAQSARGANSQLAPSCRELSSKRCPLLTRAEGPMEACR
jgi:hypothetical protein